MWLRLGKQKREDLWEFLRWESLAFPNAFDLVDLVFLTHLPTQNGSSGVSSSESLFATSLQIMDILFLVDAFGDGDVARAQQVITRCGERADLSDRGRIIDLVSEVFACTRLVREQSFRGDGQFPCGGESLPGIAPAAVSRDVPKGKSEIVLELGRIINFRAHEASPGMPRIVWRDLWLHIRVAVFGKVAVEGLQALALPFAHTARAACNARCCLAGLRGFARIWIETAIMANDELLEKTQRNAIFIELYGDEADGPITNVNTNSINTFSHDGPFAFCTTV